jgi:hypothetical protein
MQSSHLIIESQPTAPVKLPAAHGIPRNPSEFEIVPPARGA